MVSAFMLTHGFNIGLQITAAFLIATRQITANNNKSRDFIILQLLCKMVFITDAHYSDS